MELDGLFKKSRRSIGFHSYSIRMEEEDDQERYLDPPSRRGRLEFSGEGRSKVPAELIERLIEERNRIIGLLTSKELSEDHPALKLLQDNHQLIESMQGGPPYRFKTESVIYALLIFSTVITGVLAFLNYEKVVTPEVTTTFVGTAVGGILTTIAQKFGKIGR